MNSGGARGGSDGLPGSEGGNDLGLNRRKCRILSNCGVHEGGSLN
jgi:hypothetical protein